MAKNMNYNAEKQLFAHLVRKYADRRYLKKDEVPETIKGETGATGATGATGPQGATGPAGADGADGEGVPVGGTAGQILSKIDGTDYNTEWIDNTGGGGGVFEEVGNVVRESDSAYDNDFVFGSPQLNDDGTHDYRIIYDKSKGFFGAGRWSSTEVDDANRSLGGAVFGFDNINSGNYSLVSGINNNNSGTNSFIFGSNSSNSGNFSLVCGSLNSNTGTFSFMYTAASTAGNSVNTGDFNFLFGVDIKAVNDKTVIFGEGDYTTIKGRRLISGHSETEYIALDWDLDNDASYKQGIVITDNGTISTAKTNTLQNVSSELYWGTDKVLTGILKAEEIEVNEIGTSTYDDVQDFINQSQSASAWSGFDISDGGSGTIDIAAGTGMIKTTNSDNGANVSFDYAGQTAQDILADNSVNWIYIDYNSGTPIAAASTSALTVNSTTQMIIGKVYRTGTSLTIVNDLGQFNANYQALDCRKDFELSGVERASGLVLGETGTRNITTTAGVFYCAHKRTTVSAFDTSGTDTFDVWNSAASMTADTTGVSDYDPNSPTQYWNGTALTNCIVNRYTTRFFYIDFGGNLHMQYGTSNTVSIAAAETEPVPTPPPYLADFAIYIGRVVFQQGATSAEVISNPFEQVESGTIVSDHGELAGLSDDDHSQYALLNGRTGDVLKIDTIRTFTASGDMEIQNQAGSTIGTLTDSQLLILTNNPYVSSETTDNKILKSSEIDTKIDNIYINIDGGSAVSTYGGIPESLDGGAA